MTNEEGLAREAKVKALQKEYLEKQTKDFQLDPEATEEEALYAICRLTMYCHGYAPDAWRAFLSVFDRIPDRHKLRLLLDIYIAYAVDYLVFLEMLDKCLKLEPPDVKQARIERLRLDLGHRVNVDDTVEIFRGEKKGSMSSDFAISWTTGKSIAERFAKMYPWIKARRRIASARVHIGDIVYYYNNRQEEEVIIRPDAHLTGITYKRIVIEPDSQTSSTLP